MIYGVKLKPMFVSKLMEDPDMDVDEISLGSTKLEDFTWKQLLDSQSLVQNVVDAQMFVLLIILINSFSNEDYYRYPT